jgi:hypothetical protein
LVIDGVNIEDTQEKVNHLNSQFLESIPNLDDVNSNYDGDWNINNPEFSLEPCCEVEIVDVIDKFKTKISTSWDSISTRVLKRISFFLFCFL